MMLELNLINISLQIMSHKDVGIGCTMEEEQVVVQQQQQQQFHQQD
jgi:hypothetical protein